MPCRQAHPDDSQRLAHIDELASAHPWSPSRFEQLLARQAPGSDGVWVLEEGGQVNALLVYLRVLDEATVANVAVLPQHQGRGLGSQLLAEALRHLASDGVRRCLLEVRASNAVALQLYRRHGFSTDGVRKDYYPDGDGREDALLMSCQLYRE